MKYKVLRIINRFNMGGPTFNAAYLTKYLEPEFETLLIGGPHDPSEGSSLHITESLGLDPMIIEEMRRTPDPFKDVKAYRRIRRIIREFKPDIVHTHASKAGALGRLAAHHEKVPIIVHTFHGNVLKGYFGKTKTAFYKGLERRLAAYSTAIVAISDLQKKELAYEHKICSIEKIHTIPLGFDLSRFREDQEQKRRDFRKKWNLPENILCVSIIGRLVPIKNHALFLEVVSRVKKQFEGQVVFLIIGDGECRGELEAKATDLNLVWSESGFTGKEDIIFTSWEKDVDKALAGSDIVALTSDNEGTPVSLIEAQAAGKPIVSTRVGGVEDILPEGKNGLLSPPGEAESFADNLLKLLKNNDLREEMSRSGWEWVEQRFHFSRLVKDMKNLYLSLLAEKP